MSDCVIESSDNLCIKPNDVNLTLRKTFEFIQQHQLSNNGIILETTLFLALNLLKSQFSGEVADRVSASNTVTGIVTLVTNTNVVIIAKSSCENIYNEYTVEYSSIIEIDSPSVQIYYDEYVNFMNLLPEICIEEKNQYIEILNRQIKLLNNYEDTEYKGLKIIFNSVKSRLIFFSEFSVVKNLIIIANRFIIPLTYIGGYILIPNCGEGKNLEGNIENKAEDVACKEAEK